MTDGPLIYLIAGEPSGDLLGGRLMAALKERTSGRVRFAGIGGETMAAQGLESLVPIADLAVMGVAEVIPRARTIFRHVRAAVADVMRLAPDAVVTIDSSGFTWRVAHGLRRRGARMPLIHYVAPMVWVWRAARARRMARWYDHLMALFPFEPPYFEEVGLPCHYVGHPVVENGADRGDGTAFRRRHAIAADAMLLILLPGSRSGEVARLLPIFRETAERLATQYGALHVAIPTTANVDAAVRQGIAGWRIPATVVGGAEKYDAFAAGNAALAASGTVALELAMARVPSVVAYRANALTVSLVRRVAKVKYAHLVNLLLDRPAVPELLQDDCTAEKAAAALTPLIDDADACARQAEACEQALHALGYGEFSPGLRAADDVLAVIAARTPRKE